VIGKTIWTYDKSANEVQVSQFDASGSSITPQKLFTNFYDKDYLYKLNDEKKVGAKTYQVVELITRRQDESLLQSIAEY
jgi:hypothetical protein